MSQAPDAIRAPNLDDVHEPATTTETMLRCAVEAAKGLRARRLFVSAHCLDDLSILARVDTADLALVLITHGGRPEVAVGGPLFQVLAIPDVDLTRMGQIKTAMLLASTEGMLEPGETVVCLTGQNGGEADTLVVLKAGTEDEILFAPADGKQIAEKIRRVVFARALNLCLSIAGEGREGKPVGTTLVVGDHREVLKYTRQLIINPFKGYPESRRSILDPALVETVKGFATLDGAFVVKGSGVIVSAGTYLAGVPPLEDPRMQGLGARHQSAAGITAVTQAVAFVISESTGTVRVFRGGRLLTEIERGSRSRSRVRSG